MDSNQLNLFSDFPAQPAIRAQTLVMDKLAKSEVKVPNLQLSATGKRKQASAADYIVQSSPNALRAKQHRSSVQPTSITQCRFIVCQQIVLAHACIYFVIDSAIELLLYVGETCRSNFRCQGVHDCKRYIENYQNLHYQHGLSHAVNIAFW